jgi:hypothetical protein
MAVANQGYPAGGSAYSDSLKRPTRVEPVGLPGKLGGRFPIIWVNWRKFSCLLAEAFQSEKPPEAGGALAASLPFVRDAPHQPGPLHNLKTGATGLCATASMSPVAAAVEGASNKLNWRMFLSNGILF